jgi:hypothetical protein
VVSYSVNGTSFVAEKPRLWSSKSGNIADFDISPDGKRLAAVMSPQNAKTPASEHEIVFLDNFFDELRRRVPIGK